MSQIAMVADSIDYQFDLPTIADVTPMFEVDLGHLQLVDGVQQAGAPPGVRMEQPPRRSARGRSRDQLLLNLYLKADNGSDETDVEALLDLAARHFFGTPGTVTKAFRALYNAVSATLLKINQASPRGAPVTAGLSCAVWRGEELYLAQAGPGSAFVVQRASAEQFPEAAHAIRPLGMSNNPDVQFFHTTLTEGDLLVTCPEAPAGWRADTLRSVNTGELEPALSRLVHLAGNAVNASVARFVTASETGDVPAALDSLAQRRAAHRPPGVALPETEAPLPPAAESSLASILARVRAATDLGDEATLSEAALTEMLAPEPTVAVESDSPGDYTDAAPPEEEAFKPVVAFPAEALADDVVPPEEASDAATPTAPANWDWPEAVRAAAPPPPPAEEWIELDAATISDDEAGNAADNAGASDVDLNDATADWIELPAPEIDAEPEAIAHAAMAPTAPTPDVLQPSPLFPPYAETDDDEPEFDDDEFGYADDGLRRRIAWPHVELRRAIRNTLESVRDWYVSLPLERLRPHVASGSTSLGDSLSNAIGNLVGRLAPGSAPREGYTVPDRILIILALLVPLAVVVLASGLYLTEGQSKQFAAVMEQARLEASQARIAPDAAAARPHWEAALAWLDQADAISAQQPEAQQLRAEAQGVLDNLDAIVRVPIAGVTAAGFGANARITRVYAAGSDMYALDANSHSVYRAIRNVAGTFDVDGAFLCRTGLTGEGDIT
ncbi:MAG: hypothetical protein ACE5FI_01685, partial [Anaerolineales bacterium]